MKLKPPGPIMEPARRYPVMTCKIILLGDATKVLTKILENEA